MRTYDEILQMMQEQDPDYIVDVLEIQSWELLEHFPVRTRRFVLNEYEIEGIDDGTDEEASDD